MKADRTTLWLFPQRRLVGAQRDERWKKEEAGQEKAAERTPLGQLNKI